jgi:hypothetical protein
MSKREKPIILPGDPEAAKPVTITGWQSRAGHVYTGGEAEWLARSSGATHLPCESCGKPRPKYGFTLCPECRAVAIREQFAKLDRVEWDEETPLCEYQGDRYFFSLEDVDEFCDDNGTARSDLMLVLCRPEYATELDPFDLYHEMLPEEETHVPAWMHKAFEALNRVIRDHQQPGDELSWWPTSTAVTIAEVVGGEE